MKCKWIKISLIALAGLILLSGVGCKGAVIKMSSDRMTISAGGCDKAVITAIVEIDGDGRSGKTVDFETSAGSFSAIEEVTSTVVTTDGEGKATVELFATEAVGTATVTAEFYDDNYDAERSITVKFGPPSGRFLPTSDSVTLECETGNVGAMRSGSPQLRVPCHFSAQTAGGCSLPLSAFLGVENIVHMKAEAGVLESGVDDWTYEMMLYHSTSGGEDKPLDVDPADGEPSRDGPLGETFNPRDGVVTLLVAVRAREAFDDINGNGEYDAGEPFDDIGEPFLDADDDGVFTLGTDPFFYDANGDGEQTGPNGSYDATAYAGGVFKIVWSGDLDEHEDTSRYELSGSENISNGGSLTISVYTLDAFLNPVAAFADNSDRIYFDVSGYVNVTPSYYERPMTNVRAVTFDEKGRYLMYDEEASVYTVSLADDDGSWSYDPPADWSMNVTVYASPGLDSDGYFIGQDEMAFEESLGGSSQ